MAKKEEWQTQKKLFNEEIGKNLKNCIANIGITQIELAKKIQVSQPSITSWTNGTNVIDLFNTYNICKTLNISFEDLLGSYFIPKEEKNNKLKLADEEIEKLKRLIKNIN
jgi:transcriptional regulator with XRE-family HTH domain